MGNYGLTEMTINSVSVGSSTTEIVPAATSLATRECIIIANDSDEVIYLAVGKDAVLNEGIRLDIGQSIVFAGPLRTAKAIDGISTSGGKNVAVTYGY